MAPYVNMRGSSAKKEPVNKWMAWGEWMCGDDEGEGGRWRVIFLPEMYQWTRPLAIGPHSGFPVRQAPLQ